MGCPVVFCWFTDHRRTVPSALCTNRLRPSAEKIAVGADLGAYVAGGRPAQCVGPGRAVHCPCHNGEHDGRGARRLGPHHQGATVRRGVKTRCPPRPEADVTGAQVLPGDMAVQQRFLCLWGVVCVPGSQCELDRAPWIMVCPVAGLVGECAGCEGAQLSFGRLAAVECHIGEHAGAYQESQKCCYQRLPAPECPPCEPSACTDVRTLECGDLGRSVAGLLDGHLEHAATQQGARLLTRLFPACQVSAQFLLPGPEFAAVVQPTSQPRPVAGQGLVREVHDLRAPIGAAEDNQLSG